tara:strand:- start:1275 stop:2315 length:1041 start_codon:yes stop_codon:yes gene_type:complete
MKQQKKILIIGAGFSGSVIARELAEKDFKVTLIEKRNHIGGNAFDYVNEFGIRIHKYGPHIFHTNNARVYKYLSKYTEWIPYKHRVKAQLKDGRYVTFPANNETKKIVGEKNIIDIFFRPYTKKMWGLDIEKLDPGIINRIPIREDNNDLYFPKDKYQFMPKEGYTKLFERLLKHKNIKVHLNTEFKKSMLDNYHHTFSSMPIDEYYDFKFGKLPYRSIKFHHINLPLNKLLPTATVNFTHDGPHTRMTEWKNIPSHGEHEFMTSVTYEEPCDYRENNLERYYPVKDIKGKNRKIFERYLNHNKKNDLTLTFVGRCGLYVYLDMHQAISSALATSKRFLKENNLKT